MKAVKVIIENLIILIIGIALLFVLFTVTSLIDTYILKMYQQQKYIHGGVAIE